MRKTLVAALMAALLLAPMIGQEGILLATGEWDPYTSAKLKDGGFITNLVAAVCRKAGMRVRTEFHDWGKAEALVKVGTAFAAFPYPINPYYSNDYYQSEPLANNIIVFMYLAGGKVDPKAFQDWKLSDFKGRKIALLPGTPSEGRFREAGVEILVQPTTDENIASLLAGKVDFVVNDVFALRSTIEKSFAKDSARLKFLGKPYNQVAIGLIVSKSYPNARALLDSFDTALRSMRDSGEYNRLVGSYRGF